MKKGFLIILLLIILSSLATSIQAAEEKKTTIVPYLNLPGAEDPTAGIPQYIRYIFVFSLGVVGIIAFISILVAAFGYVTSVGNPQKATAAKDRIFSSLLGILLLLGSYLLLNAINPDLLRFKITGEKVDIPVEGPKESERCQFQWAGWDKFELTVGESATLTFGATKECKDAKFEKKTHIQITQDKPDKNECAFIKQDCSDYFYKEADCAEIKTAGTGEQGISLKFLGMKEIKNPDDSLKSLEFLFKYTFNQYCAGKCPNFGKPPTGAICNYKEDDKEIFHVKGEIKIEGQTMQYVSGLKMTVIDAR